MLQIWPCGVGALGSYPKTGEKSQRSASHAEWLLVVRGVVEQNRQSATCVRIDIIPTGPGILNQPFIALFHFLTDFVVAEKIARGSDGESSGKAMGLFDLMIYCVI
ncbi:MAG: hypothetical protein NPIRA01_13790 [Nitrospirales bacterium]|nr:MAG: hypothetical protein NPIRA01_13790 [Nitrospirales bacterium]